VGEYLELWNWDGNSESLMNYMLRFVSKRAEKPDRQLAIIDGQAAKGA